VERIVIVGGGFAGLHLIRQLRLRAHEATVTLVDRNNYHLFTPLLYQVATGELAPHAVAYPLRHATAPAGIGFLQQLVGARNKATLLAEWALSFVLHRQVANIP
jgi:NADH dehydrogenase FAD-containing subunit